MINKGNPDTGNTGKYDTMWRLHCKAAFAEMKEAIERVVQGQKEIRDAQADDAKEIAALKVLVTNGLSTRVDRMDRRLWVILGSMLALAGALITLAIRG